MQDAQETCSKALLALNFTPRTMGFKFFPCGIIFKDSYESQFAVTQHRQLCMVAGSELGDRSSQPATFC